MLKKHEQHQVHDLLEAGLTTPEVAKRTGKSLGTIYKYKKIGRNIQSWGNDERADKIPEKLAPFEEFLDTRLARRKVKFTELFFSLQQQGFKGSRYQFDQYAKKRRAELQPVKDMKHIETAPGEQAQVDWGHFGEITINGRREKVYLFAYILSWSRAIYLEFVVRQNQGTLQACHIHAFEKLGIPRTILYDNMKTVVVRREKLADDTEKVHFNVNFLDFARYYQFEVKACPPYWPRAKGKVEATIKYTRRYFTRYTPSMNTTLEELNCNLTAWVDGRAHQRIHGTTGEKPIVRWEQEKSLLRFPDNLPSYRVNPIRTHKTSQYGIFSHGNITYHFGSEFAFKKIDVREVQDHGLPYLEMYHKNALISTVPVPAKNRGWVTVFDDTTPAKPVDSQQRKRQQHKPYDIAVAVRDLDYYSIPVNSD